MRLTDVIPVGTVLKDRYELQQVLGAGGFAVVFEAFDRVIERRVAVKIMNIMGIDNDEVRDEFQSRFTLEAKIAAKVDHPNILNIHDFGFTAHEIPFIVMEFLEGYDLEYWAHTEGPLDGKWLIPHFIDLLEALGYCHEQGIVHKDLKPSNIYLRYPKTRRESMCILDFGIAYLRSFSARLTRANTLTGTPAYMAPEYPKEQPITAAVDVYQMGLILTEFLIGKPVVDAEDPMLAIFKHARGNLEFPAELLESPVGYIIRKATSLRPSERFRNGFDFADALRGIDLEKMPSFTRGGRVDISGEIPKQNTPRNDNLVTTQDQPVPMLLPPPPEEMREPSRAGTLIATPLPTDLKAITLDDLPVDDDLEPPVDDSSPMLPPPTQDESSSEQPGKAGPPPVNLAPPNNKTQIKKGPTQVLKKDTLLETPKILPSSPTHLDDEDDYQEQKSSPLFLIVPVFILIVSIIGLAMVLAPTEENTKPLSTKEITKKTNDSKTTPKTKAKETKPTTAASSIVVTSVPTGASVFRGAAQIGTTPFKLSFKQDNPETLTLKLSGFEEKTIKIDSAQESLLKFDLAPVAAKKDPPKAEIKKKSPAKKTRKDPKTKKDPEVKKDPKVKKAKDPKKTKKKDTLLIPD